MNGYSVLLGKAASEMRAFAQTSEARFFPPEWLEKLAARFEAASGLSESNVCIEIETLSRYLADSGPTLSESVPSFGTVIDAYQRAKRRQGRL